MVKSETNFITYIKLYINRLSCFNNPSEFSSAEMQIQIF